VFHKPLDYEAFLSLLAEAKQRHRVKLFAFCLMPNHFHLVLEPAHQTALSQFMQWLLTSHVRRYHKHYGSSGHIWQGRFKSFPVQRDEHLITVLRYRLAESGARRLVKYRARVVVVESAKTTVDRSVSRGRRPPVAGTIGRTDAGGSVSGRSRVFEPTTAFWEDRLAS
jgi:REP element-mobilizing transposase RayT